MKFLTAAAAAPFLLALSMAADAACVYPQAPTSLPNGNTATKDEMLAGQATVKEYKTAVEETYLPCLEQEKLAGVAALDPADKDFAKKKDMLEQLQAKKHNAALDEEQAVAARWNEEIKAFRAKTAK
jgi:hypothetical protein